MSIDAQGALLNHSRHGRHLRSAAERRKRLKRAVSWCSKVSGKFGKYIQKRQLDLPEYAASFVDYKALKKLIKRLSATPVILPHKDGSKPAEPAESQTSLQANKATFFFRLERELEKVNTFYLQKEAELKLRLTTLLDKKRAMQGQSSSAPKLSSKYITLEEGFRQFSTDLNKLQQFVEINATAFSKILKKWDKTSKSRTKELYLSRAVEVQPCFNRDVISDLSDQATTNLLDLGAWAEGEKMQYSASSIDPASMERRGESDEIEVDAQILRAISAGNEVEIRTWLARLGNSPIDQERVTRAFASTADEAPEVCLKALLETNMVDLRYIDEINERNCLHNAAISGRMILLEIGLSGGIDVRATDIYGRIPLHYACMHGRVEMIPHLVAANPETIDAKDQESFTPLIHSIRNSQLACVQTLLAYGASINPGEQSGHIPLNLACQTGSVPIVETLLQKHPEICPDAEGLYPQHLVARSGKSPQLLLTLKEYGVDLNQADKLYQWTPLFHAASEGHVECLQVLLRCNVRVDVLDEKGLSAMYYATWEGHLECMKVLAAIGQGQSLFTRQQQPQQLSTPALSGGTPAPMSAEPEGIPPISLPPPIIPLRRYGHNFLDTKTFVVIILGDQESDAIQFYDNSKYPAARLTISSKSSDLIPRNLLLPVQDEFKTISFQIDNLDSFSIDFDIFPTFGSKVIARTVASSKIFTAKANGSGYWFLELFNPRLKTIGRITFRYQVVKPFHGIPLEITQFATYWKATSQFQSHPNALITGSSLSGEYIRLFVQITRDGTPILFPQWRINHFGLDVPINSLTYDQFVSMGAHHGSGAAALSAIQNIPGQDIPRLYQTLASSFAPLRDVLALLAPEVHVELHVLYPNRTEADMLRLGPTPNINDYVDAVLTVVFEHARNFRHSSDNFYRSVVFSSFNQDVCTALNWKQPNYPVLLCNELGVDSVFPTTLEAGVYSSGRTTISVKEAVRIAQSNNFMGLICSSRLMMLVPTLIESIKAAGLVLVADVSDDSGGKLSSVPMASPAFYGVPEGIDGVLKQDGVLRFRESIDM